MPITPPDELAGKLAQYENVETAVAVYKEAAGLAAAYKAVMDAARQFVGAYVRETGEVKGRTAIGSFGLTRPKKKFALDTDAWERAAQSRPELRQTQIAFERAKAEYEAARRALDAAQTPFKTLDVTPKGNPYIR